jgi:hypothetical protein
VNFEAAHSPSPAALAQRGHAKPWRDAAGLMSSVLFHALVLILLLSPVVQQRHHAGRPATARALVITLAPQPRPAAAAAPAKPLAARAQAAKAPAKPATATAAPHAAAAPPSEAEIVDDVMGRIRDNWLEPPGAAAFRCRVRIDYTAAGMISKLSFPQPCGDSALEDSVKRAIWKTQPLLHTSAAGSLEIDFTP